MAGSAEEENTHDIVDFTPDLVKVIDDEETAKLVMDELYFPILKVLRKGPMTVKELEEKYNEEAKQQKSDKTIYRYLKTLQKADLVVSAGQRVVKGKTATETLFSRSAYGFYLRNEFADFWATDQGRMVTNALGEALNPLVPDKNINLDKFQDFLHKLSNERIDKLRDILEKADKKLMEGISGLDWQKFTTFYDLGGILAVILTDPQLIERLKTCFE